MSTFGDRLRDLRKQHNLQQKDLAETIGVSKSAISMYEQNEREPSFNILISISNQFNVTIDYLLTGEDRGLSDLDSNLTDYEKEFLLIQLKLFRDWSDNR